MNKLFFFSIILFSQVASAQVQTAKGKFRAGFSFGATVSDVNGADTRDNDNDFHKIGLTAGGLVNTAIGKKNTLQMEINFVQCGSLQPPDSLNNGYYNLSLAYIEIPLVIRHRVNFSIRKKPVDKLDLEAGLSYSRLISQRVINATNSLVYGTSSLYNLSIANLVLGANYNLRRNLYFSLRYTNSFIPAIKRNPINFNTITYTFNKGNNMVFSLCFKYIFEGKKAETEPKPEE